MKRVFLLCILSVLAIASGCEKAPDNFQAGSIADKEKLDLRDSAGEKQATDTVEAEDDLSRSRRKNAAKSLGLGK